MITRNIFFFFAMIVCVLGADVCYGEGKELRWNIRNTNTTPTISATGIRSKNALTTVAVRIESETQGALQRITFKSTSIKHDSRDQTRVTTYIPFADKEKLNVALKEASKKMSAPYTQDFSDSIYSGGNLSVCLIGKSKKKYLEASFPDDRVFQLDKAKVDQFAMVIKNIK